MLEQYTLKGPTVQAILNYLAAQPYGSVVNLLNQIASEVAPQDAAAPPAKTAKPKPTK